MHVKRSEIILAVDDAAPMRAIIRGILESGGFSEVLEAKDGVEALEILEKVRVDLVMADWKMPRLDGYGLLRKLREDERFKTLPFLMVTVDGQKENVLQAVKAGVSGYVLKPIPADKLLLKVFELLS
jgi:two-component system, chemotaxis family, chemotaxis protein CheY